MSCGSPPIASASSSASQATAVPLPSWDAPLNHAAARGPSHLLPAHLPHAAAALSAQHPVGTGSAPLDGSSLLVGGARAAAQAQLQAPVPPPPIPRVSTAGIRGCELAAAVRGAGGALAAAADQVYGCGEARRGADGREEEEGEEEEDADRRFLAALFAEEMREMAAAAVGHRPLGMDRALSAPCGEVRVCTQMDVYFEGMEHTPPAPYGRRPVCVCLCCVCARVRACSCACMTVCL